MTFLKESNLLMFQEVMNRFSEMLTQRMLQNLFLEETEITCLLKREWNWRSRNTKWNLSKILSVSFSNKRMLNDWIWNTHITDMLNLDENTFDCKKNISCERKNFSRNSNSKHSWNGRNEQSSRIKSWWIFCTVVERMSWNKTKIHFTSTRSTRKD